MIRVREREVENAKKQIELNDHTIGKLRERMKTLEAGGSKGAGSVDWEARYRKQVDLREQLEK